MTIQNKLLAEIERLKIKACVREDHGIVKLDQCKKDIALFKEMIEDVEYLPDYADMKELKKQLDEAMKI